MLLENAMLSPESLLRALKYAPPSVEPDSQDGSVGEQRKWLVDSYSEYGEIYTNQNTHGVDTPQKYPFPSSLPYVSGDQLKESPLLPPILDPMTIRHSCFSA
jgi:hypothetical protein